jgi:LacI family transcriptional regulator
MRTSAPAMGVSRALPAPRARDIHGTFFSGCQIVSFQFNLNPMRIRPVTLKMIALRCGVSTSAVSDILGKRSHLFSPDTRDRVRRMAAELGYKPSSAARAMQRGRFESVAFLLHGYDALFPRMMVAIEEVLAARHIHVTTMTIPGPWAVTGPNQTPALRELCADGLIIGWDIPRDLVVAAQNHVFPVVWVNVKRPWDCVRCDEEYGTHLATGRLLSLGHRAIAYADYTVTTHYSSTDRPRGYVRAMQAAGLRPRLERDVCRVAGEREARARAWLAATGRATAVITYSVATAVPVLVAALSLGLQVPRDLSLVTVHSVLADEAGLPITTLLEPETEVGRAAARMLLARMARPGRRMSARVFRQRLLPGATCAPPPADRA